MVLIVIAAAAALFSCAPAALAAVSSQTADTASSTPTAQAQRQRPPETITRQYTYVNDDEPTVPVRVENAQGYAYIFQTKTVELAPDQVLEKPLVRDVTVDAPFGSDPVTALAAELPVDEDGYAGTLELSGHAETPTYTSRTHMVDRTVVFEDLPDNDVTRIPEEQTFTISSDALPNATTEASLRRASVSMAVSSVDEDGSPATYTATVVYRGQESYLEQTGWHVTGTYAGTVDKKEVHRILTATYALEMPPVPEIDFGGGATTVEETAGFWDSAREFIVENGQLIARVLGAGLAAALFATAIVLYRRKKDQMQGGRNVG